MTSAIYGILNLLNGKIYIGSAVNVDSRLRTHKSRLNLNKHPSKHLQGAYNEYGAFAFEFIVLEYVRDKTELLEREEVWFKLTACCNPQCGYNKRKIPNSNLGLKLGPASEERKLKSRLSNLGKKRSLETIENISASQTGKKRTLEHIANAVKSRAGYKHSSDTATKIGIANSNLDKWPHGYRCKCRECLDKKNLDRRLNSYNHNGIYAND